MQPIMPFLTSLHPSPNAASSDYSNGLWCQVVDADTQKAMLAWYYKKQEEEKVRNSAVQQLWQYPALACLLAKHMIWTGTAECHTQLLIACFCSCQPQQLCRQPLVLGEVEQPQAAPTIVCKAAGAGSKTMQSSGSALAYIRYHCMWQS
jgi:hypothetical protein